MSISATSVSEVPLAGQNQASSSGSTPTKRQSVAKADVVAQPEPR